MANESGFFPNELYGPDDFTTYFRDFYSNGIKAEDANYFAVLEKSGMALTVQKGIAYIDGHFYRPSADFTVTLAESDTEFDRVDLVEIKCDYTANRVYVDVITGEPSEAPSMPELQRDAAAYCLGLAAVTVKANASEVTQADIKDLRFDTDYCGVVVGKIDTISTTDLFAQYSAQWELLKAACAQDADAVIKAWEKLVTVTSVNGKAPSGGNVTLTQSDIPSDGTAYQMPFYVQSGTLTVGKNALDGIDITFPQAFKAAPLIIFGASVNPSYAKYPTAASYNNLTNEGFTLIALRVGSSGASTIPDAAPCVVNWVALGQLEV